MCSTNHRKSKERGREMMKKFYKKISDLMYSDFMGDYILPLVVLLLFMMAVTIPVYKAIQIKEERYFQTKYEFITQDNEVKEGYGCKTQYGKATCIGDDGTKYFGVKSYKKISVQETQEEVQETTNETKEYYLDGYYLVTITFDDNYKDLDFKTLETHFKSNYNAKSVLIDDDGVAGTEIFCEKAEIDNIKELLESDYLVQGYEILEFKRSD